MISGLERPGSSEPRLIRNLRDEIERGLTLASDPVNANLTALALRGTTIYSPWFVCTCKVCRFKFRVGDLVRLCPKCKEPYHADEHSGLDCWQRHFAPGHICSEGGKDRFGEDNAVKPSCDFIWDGKLAGQGPPQADATPSNPSPHAALVTHFIGGLEAAWRPFGGVETINALPGSESVGRRCPICRFLIRAGDWVVACPCKCGTYIHQDVFRQLTCWNEWNGVQGKNFCPNIGSPLSRRTDDRR